VETPQRKEAAARWTRLWKALSAEERKAAALAYLSAAETVPVARTSAMEVLARETRTRPATVSTWPLSKRADRLARLGRLDPPLAAVVVARHLVSAHGPMVRRFLDLVGLAHTDGEIQPQATSGRCETSQLRTAIAALSGEFPARDVAYFLDALEGQRIPYLDQLPALRADRGGAPDVAP
jgi:hypothetical protein